MATYYFNKTQLSKFVENLNSAADDSEIWFIPTHHGGCLQVLQKDNKTHNVYCTKRTGYSKFCDDSCCIMSALKLKDKFVMMLCRCVTAKFTVKILKDTKQIAHVLTTKYA